MNELRDLLERGAGAFEPPLGGWDRLLRRAGRRRALRRVTAGVVALVVAGAGIGVVMAAFRGTEHPKPAAPVENGPIAYVLAGSSDWDIYTVRPDGTGRTRLTDEKGWDQDSAWSPDGTRIAFTTFRPRVEGNPPAIWVMNAAGTDQHLLVANAFGPSWSPDGRRIAFSREVDGNVDIYMINDDGTGLVRLTDDPARDVSPTWSPDSTQIAFVRDSSGSGDGPLYVMNADGTDAREVLSDPVVGDPRWSPDRDRIVFDTPRGANPDGPTDLFFVNADGTGLIRLTDDEARELSPGWSPDGSEIAFSSDRDGVRQIYAMDTDGSGLAKVTSGPDPAAFPAWGPMPSQPVSPSPTASASPTASISPRISATLDLGPNGGTSSILAAEGSIWVTAYGVEGGGGPDQAMLLRIDPTTNEIASKIPIDSAPGWDMGGGGLAAGDGSIWVTGPGRLPGHGAGAVLDRIDPTTNGVVTRTFLGGKFGADVVIDGSGVWALVFESDTSTEVFRLDPKTGDVVATIRLEEPWAHRIYSAAGAIWVNAAVFNNATLDHSVLVKIDPETNSIVATFPGKSFGTFDPGSGVIWDAAPAGQRTGLVAIDPETMHAVGDPVPVAPAIRALGLLADETGNIWFEGYDDSVDGDVGSLERYDSSSCVIDASVQTPKGQPVQMAVTTATSLWTVNYDGTVTRIDLSPNERP